MTRRGENASAHCAAALLVLVFPIRQAGSECPRPTARARHRRFRHRRSPRVWLTCRRAWPFDTPCSVEFEERGGKSYRATPSAGSGHTTAVRADLLKQLHEFVEPVRLTDIEPGLQLAHCGQRLVLTVCRGDNHL